MSRKFIFIGWFRKKKKRFREIKLISSFSYTEPNGVMLSAVSLPNHTFTGQA